MLRHDLHVHSLRSQCGTMTLLEIVEHARRNDMRTVAVTDHSMAFTDNRFQFHIFCKRFPDEVDGVRVLKGIELNVMSADGDVDVPEELLPWFDWVLLGMHPVRACYRDQGPAANTAALVAALRRHPWIDAVAHPTQRAYPLDFTPLLPVMAELGVAFEVNECGLVLGKADAGATAEVLVQAVDAGVPVVANSDAHVFHELGGDRAIGEVFARADVDRSVALNADRATMEAWIADKRDRRAATARELGLGSAAFQR